MKSIKERVRVLLQESVTSLCKNSLNYSCALSVEGLIGITLDNQEVLLVNINKTITLDEPALESIEQVDKVSAPNGRNGFSADGVNEESDGNVARISKLEQNECAKNIHVNAQNKNAATCRCVSKDEYNPHIKGGLQSKLNVPENPQLGGGVPGQDWSNSSTSESFTGKANVSNDNPGKRCRLEMPFSDIKCRKVAMCMENATLVPSTDVFEKQKTKQDRFVQGNHDAVNKVKKITETTCQTATTGEDFTVIKLEPNSGTDCSKHENHTSEPFEAIVSDDKSGIKNDASMDNAKIPPIANSITGTSLLMAFHSTSSSAVQKKTYLDTCREMQEELRYRTNCMERQNVQRFAPAIFPTDTTVEREHTLTTTTVTPENKMEADSLVRSSLSINTDYCLGDPGPIDPVMAIMRFEGHFVTTRILGRRLSWQIPGGRLVKAMIELTRPRNHPKFVGQYFVCKKKIKVFYKCPPSLLAQEALEEFGMSIEEYTNLYHQMPAKPPEETEDDWLQYLDNVQANSPFWNQF